MVQRRSILHLFTLLGLAGAGAAAVASQGAPLQQRPPTFRSTIDVVPLTVSVVDRQGRPVRDLTASDFTVFENERVREIVNFYPQAFRAMEVPPGPAERNRVRDERIAPETRRTFLIVLGYGRIQHPTNALDGAAEFVRQRLLPQDAVAVMGFHRVTTFTTDHEAIARLLERYKKAHEKIVFDIDEFRLMSRSPYGGSGGPPIPDRLLRPIDDVFLGPQADRPGRGDPAPFDLRSTTDLLFGMDRALQVTEAPWRRQESFADINRAIAESGDELTDEVLLGTRLKFYAGIEYLRYLDGERHMLFLANFPGVARNVDDAQIVARRAADARVIVDYVATNGTYAPRRGGGGRGGGGDPPSRVVAELTGGYYTSLEVASKATAKIDEATRFSYLLGYEPSNPALDGRYRDVDVRVNRQDVTVRFAHGYYAAPEPTPLELEELLVKSRLERALSYDSEAKDLTVTATAYQLPRMGLQMSTRVEVTVDASQLGWTVKDGVHTAALELQVYCGDAKENVLGDSGERLDLEAGDELYQQWLQTGIRRVVRVPVMQEPKYVKVVVYDYGSEKVGSFMFTIKK